MVNMSNQKQRGAALVFALVILLVMTIVGVATMENSTLQERMAGNDRQKKLAVNAAEFALRTAEQWLIDNVQSTADLGLFNGTPGSGRYSMSPRPPGIGGANPLAGVDVSRSADWAALGVEVGGLSADVTSQNPRYIIEYLGQGQISSATTKVISLNEDANQGEVAPYFFRITAIGWSRDENIYSVLESSFRTGYGNGVFVY